MQSSMSVSFGSVRQVFFFFYRWSTADRAVWFRVPGKTRGTWEFFKRHEGRMEHFHVPLQKPRCRYVPLSSLFPFYFLYHIGFGLTGGR